MKAESFSLQFCAQFFCIQVPPFQPEPMIHSLCSSPNFAPISLCNIGCRVITKTLANRLKNIMPSYNQNSFILDREYYNIPGNLTSNAYKKERNQVDLEKAYDRLKWKFIRETLQKVGPSNTWIRNIMAFVWKGKFLDWFT